MFVCPSSFRGKEAGPTGVTQALSGKSPTGRQRAAEAGRRRQAASLQELFNRLLVLVLPPSGLAVFTLPLCPTPARQQREDGKRRHALGSEQNVLTMRMKTEIKQEFPDRERLIVFVLSGGAGAQLQNLRKCSRPKITLLTFCIGDRVSDLSMGSSFMT